MELAGLELQMQAGELRDLALQRIGVAHHVQSGHQWGVGGPGQTLHLVQRAVDAETNPDVIGFGLDVDVAGACAESEAEHLCEQLLGVGLAGLVEHVEHAARVGQTSLARRTGGDVSLDGLRLLVTQLALRMRYQ